MAIEYNNETCLHELQLNPLGELCVEICVTFPWGTLIGVFYYTCMINDLQINYTTIKYVDHTTNKVDDTSLWVAVDAAIQWP